jgi:spore coat polysaccharide biosynthesis predicted glycosyltransferase SpsG
MRRSVVIRADGGRHVGTGHLARMLRLAQRLSQSGGTVTFVSRPLDARSLDGCSGLLEAGGYGLVLLPPISDSSGAQAASAVSALEPDLILNDVHDTSHAYMRALRATGARLVNFDDRGAGAWLADVLVDANRAPEEASEAGGARALFGPDYIVLDEAFERAHRLPKGVRERVEELLVFMGGSDPAGLTLRALRAIERLDTPWHTTVVLGYAYQDRAEAVALAARCRHVDVVSGADDLAPRMQGADMALCSGGITMFELACVGTPAVVWCQVPHELDNARTLAGHGIVRCLGLGDAVTAEAVAQSLVMLAGDVPARRAMSEAGKRAVDGRGLSRVVEAIEQCVLQS